MEKGKARKRKRNVSSKKKGTWISRPFGRFADEFASDSSDSDYEPEDGSIFIEKAKRRTEPLEGSSSSTGSRDVSKLDECKNKRRSGRKYAPEDEHLNLNVKLAATSDWNSMPSEIIVKVFTFLVQELNGIQLISRSGMTCRQWYYGSRHPSLWRKVDLSFMSSSVKATDKTVTNLLKSQGDHIAWLALNNWIKLTDKGMMAISRMCPNLETLSISGCKDGSKNAKGISTDSIISVIEKCPLKFVDLSWLKLPNSGKIIHSLMEKRGKDLKSLNLCGCPVRLNILNVIMEFCPNLQILDVSNTWIYTINIEKLQAACPKIQELYIAKSNLTMKSSKHESNCFQDLVALSIQCDSLTDDLLAQTVRNSKQLSLLDLRTCRFITMQALVNIESENMERLFLSRACVSFSLEIVLNKWGDSLRELDLSWVAPSTNSHGLDNQSLKRISEVGGKYTEMRSLDLSGTAVCDEGVRHILHVFPNLDSLNLTSCKGVSRGLKHHHHHHDVVVLRKKLAASK